jgi:hypothetical protein
MNIYLPSRLGAIAAVAAAGIVSPSFAQSYSFPTYAYQHPLPGEASIPQNGKIVARRGPFYNSTVVTGAPSTSNFPEWSAVGRGNSH